MKKTLLFKNQNFPDEFRCTRVPIYDEILIRAQEREQKICFPDEKLEPNEIDLPPDSNFIIDLTQICTMLAERDNLPKDLFSSLKTQLIDKYEQINDKEKEDDPWPSKIFIIDTSISNIRIKSHLGNRSCYTIGCSGGFCTGEKSMWENTKFL
ncbi:hypothetical protein M0802_014344 [Mischocyttarus mexicanus]|nr:hypothetical protein M0802_014344 [Mischocyttarus mexicanus]